MLITGSVLSAYNSALEVALEVQRLAGSRLRTVCADNHWLFDDRIKTAESALSKVESGRGGFGDLNDLYAAMIVVPTRNQIEPAMLELEPVVTYQTKVRSNGKHDSFAYDDVHLIATLEGKVSPAVVSSNVRERRFEVQVRTGLQYAWWSATHDQIYKSVSSGRIGWHTLRTSSQARAALEMLDGILTDLEAASQLHQSQSIDPPDNENDTKYENWLSLWRPDRRPHNVLRFVETARSLVESCNVEFDTIDKLLKTSGFSTILADTLVTPLQAIAIALLRIVPFSEFEDSLRRNHAKIMVTAEAVAHQPDLGTLRGDVVVRL
ncbi:MULTISPECIES: hypothetical protein [Tsukamurella]|uniref:RelA/SpoT domain-containing protein n=2 Tax=Tsukamurella TaxID=2060 RepID=A0A5C5RVU1_9ACTN|nr:MULTISPECIES: hypothetical protein [Tsukamurella]NMD56341.1 hypothetical protein [Tsukamurella columbiensis]TWS26894.1 hypothetical protein FK530_21025 [Tsukamurella conjunctivitidis]